MAFVETAVYVVLSEVFFALTVLLPVLTGLPAVSSTRPLTMVQLAGPCG